MLYVEDNAADAELALVALRRTRLANPIRIVRDGAEALDFLFCRGAHAKSRISRTQTCIARHEAAQG
jgi:two-component system response regulator